MNKIKKYYPLIVGLVLLISVAAYGTRAYFSDSTSQEAGIKLTLGDVKIKGESFNWVYNSKGINDNQLKDSKGNLIDKTKLTSTADFTNVKPGDSFTKKFKFTNDSSLKTTFSFEEKISAAVDNSPYNINFKVIETIDQQGSKHDVSIEDISNQQNVYTLQGQESATVELTLTVDSESMDNTYNSGSNEFINDNDVLDLMKESIIVKLDQAK
ncbi:hypothetical protein [Desemzia sp. FAM 24101]|uniref:hypothetical protein n=1 Tax=unclassified Desemzia TaxID=2685243 RepID=UPI00388A79E7